MIAVLAIVTAGFGPFDPVQGRRPPDYAVSQTIPAEGRPHFPAIHPETGRLYASDTPAGTVTMFDAVTGAKLAETPTAAGAHTVVVDVEHNRVYVTNRGADTLSVLDGETR